MHPAGQHDRHDRPWQVFQANRIIAPRYLVEIHFCAEWFHKAWRRGYCPYHGAGGYLIQSSMPRVQELLKSVTKGEKTKHENNVH